MYTHVALYRKRILYSNGQPFNTVKVHNYRALFIVFFREGEFVDLEKEFEPNILNSVVYLIDMGMQVSTFAVNYRGEPFMQSLWSHKPLRNCLLITFVVVLTLTAHLMPELNQWFQLVPFPEDVSILTMPLFHDLITFRKTKSRPQDKKTNPVETFRLKD